jgi:predicted tellurium resistance membrane protein TerC
MSVNDSKKIATNAFKIFSGAALAIISLCMIILSSVLARWLSTTWFLVLLPAAVLLILGLVLLLRASKG